MILLNFINKSPAVLIWTIITTHGLNSTPPQFATANWLPLSSWVSYNVLLIWMMLSFSKVNVHSTNGKWRLFYFLTEFIEERKKPLKLSKYNLWNKPINKPLAKIPDASLSVSQKSVNSTNLFARFTVKSQAIHVEDGSFSWDKEEAPILQKYVL